MANTVPSDYITGTITLTNGSAAFTGTGTGWLAMMFRQGDMILDLPDAPEYIAIIDEVTTNTAGTLTRPWLGPTLTGAYRMRYQWDAGRVTAMSAFLREELGNGNLQAFAALVGSAGGVPVFIGPGAMEVRPATDFVNGVAYDVQVDTLADRAAFDGQSEGFAVLVSDVGDGRSALYSKASNTVGDWTDPAYITGPIGEAPAFAAGTTTTVPPGTPADVNLVPDGSGGYLFDFDIPAGEGFVSRGAYSGATAYVKGDVVQNNGSSWIAKIATTGNAPPVLPTVSNTWWELLAAAGANGTGTGDVVGPASATDGAFVGFDGTTGKLIKQLTNTVATSMLNTFATTLKGLVPGPSAGDVTANRLLRADGTWVNPPSSLPVGGTARQVLRKISATDGDAGWSNSVGFGTAQNSTSGASVDFTGLPAGCRRITVQFLQVSTNGNANYIVQLGSTTIQATGYFGAAGNTAATDQYTTGFGIRAGAGTVVMNGIMTIERINANSWVASGSFGRSDAASISSGGGSVTLSGELDRVRITTVGGADTFDGGLINITFE